MTRQQRLIARLPTPLYVRPLGSGYATFVGPQKLTPKGRQNARDYYERLWRELKHLTEDQ